MKSYINVAQLRELLIGMEQELGLDDLSQNEKDVFYAAQSVLGGKRDVAKSDEIRNHILVRSMTQPTFHRSLKSLVAKGLLDHAPNTKAGSYILARDAIAS